MKDYLGIKDAVEKVVEEGLETFRGVNRSKFEDEIFNMNKAILRSENVYDFSEEIGFSKSLAGDIKESQKLIKDTANNINRLMDNIAALANQKYIKLIKEELFSIIYFDEDNKSEDEICKELEERVLEKINKNDTATISTLITYIKLKLYKYVRTNELE